MTWTEELTPDERASWDSWVRHQREDTVKKMKGSAFVAQLIPSATAEPDIQFACEIGLAILMDKPIVAIAFPGRVVPPKLRKVADRVIEMTEDLDTEPGRAQLARELKTFGDEVDA